MRMEPFERKAPIRWIVAREIALYDCLVAVIADEEMAPLVWASGTFTTEEPPH